ncbi:MAG: secretion system protein [Thermoproteus sp.]
MNDLYLALLIALLTALGGYLIRDLQALGIFVGLSATAAFLMAFLFNAPGAVLGLVGLAVAGVKIVRAPKVAARARQLVRHTYRSRRRLEELEEMARSLSRVHIIDVVPAGSRRAIHPKVIQLLEIADKAREQGYQVAEPTWLREVRLYRRLLGSEFAPDEPTIVSDTEVFTLE